MGQFYHIWIFIWTVLIDQVPQFLAVISGVHVSNNSWFDFFPFFFSSFRINKGWRGCWLFLTSICALEGNRNELLTSQFGHCPRHLSLQKKGNSVASLTTHQRLSWCLFNWTCHWFYQLASGWTCVLLNGHALGNNMIFQDLSIAHPVDVLSVVVHWAHCRSKAFGNL